MRTTHSNYINAHAAINTNTNARKSPTGRSNTNNVVNYHDDLDVNESGANDSLQLHQCPRCRQHQHQRKELSRQTIKCQKIVNYHDENCATCGHEEYIYTQILQPNQTLQGVCLDRNNFGLTIFDHMPAHLTKTKLTDYNILHVTVQ